jgi:hypothetical protein
MVQEFILNQFNPLIANLNFINFLYYYFIIFYFFILKIIIYFIYLIKLIFSLTFILLYLITQWILNRLIFLNFFFRHFKDFIFAYFYYIQSI